MKNYVLSGLSQRGIQHFALPLLGLSDGPNFDHRGRLTGVYDPDTERVRAFLNQRHLNLPIFASLDAMLSETDPDCALIAGPDGTHAEQIVAALNSGIDVISEKPMVIDCSQARAVMEAERRSRGKVTVAFNFRYLPLHRELKRILMEGRIGVVTNIAFNYSLDELHGSSYFFRWNRQRELSGGLSISKSVHHFDLINWLLDDEPEQLFAFGALNHFGPGSPHNPTRASHRPPAADEVAKGCPFFRNCYLESGSTHRGLMASVERELPFNTQYPKPLYLYDREIDIEDTYACVTRYRSGAFMTYSINFCSTLQGYSLTIHGTQGRIDVECFFELNRPQRTAPKVESLRVAPLFKDVEEIPIPQGSGSHGGADYPLQRDLFEGPSQESLELGLCAGSRAGAVAVAAGEAMWRSAVENRSILIGELLDMGGVKHGSKKAA